MPHDPKYQFGDDDSVYHRAGDYWLPDDEPVMMIRGKDTMAVAAIGAYVERAVSLALDPRQPAELRRLAAEHAATSAERLAAFLTYQQAHPDRAGVGCHTCQETLTTP